MANIVPVVPAPPAIIQPFCKRVSAISVKRLGAYSTNPIRLTKKGPLSTVNVQDGEILEEVRQIDTTLFQVDVVDDNGETHSFNLVVPAADD